MELTESIKVHIENGDNEKLYALLNQLEQKLEQKNSVIENLKIEKQETEKRLNASIETLQKRLVQSNVDSELIFDKNTQFKKSLLNQLIESMPTFSWAFVDSDGVYQMVSGRYLAWANKSLEEIVGKKTSEIIGPENYKYVEGSFKEALRGKKQVFEMPTLDEFGRDIILNVSYIPTYDTNQKQIGLYIFTQDITDLRNKEKALAISEAKYKSVFDKSPFQIIQGDINGVIKMVSPSAFNQFDYDVSGVIGSNMKDFVLKEDYHFLFEGLEAFSNGAEEFELNFRSIDITGKTYRMKGMAVPIRDTFQNCIGSILMFYDATEEHKAEMQLKESKELFEKLYENLFESVLIYDFKNERITDCNQATVDMLGYQSKSDLIGVNRFDLKPQFLKELPDVDFHKESLKLNDIVKQGKIQRIQGYYTTQTGEVLKGKMSIIPTHRKEEEAFIVFHDLTKSIDRKKALKASEERYKILVESSPFGVALNDIDGNRLFASKRAAEMFGYESPEDMISMSSLDIAATPERKQRIKETMQEIVEAKGNVVNRFFTGRRQDNSTFYCELNARIIEEDGEQKFLIFYNEVTEREQARQALADREALLSAIIESITDSIWVFDLERNVLNMNNIAKKYFEIEFGINLKEGDNIEGKLKDSAHFSFFDGLYKEVEKGTHLNIPYIVEDNGEGVRLFIDVALSPLMNKEGQIIGTLGASRNVTKLKEQEKALAKSKATLQAVIDSIPFGLYALDTEMNLIYANDIAIRDSKKYSGYEIYHGCNFNDIIEPRLLADWRRRFFDKVFAGNSFQTIGREKDSNGKEVVLDNRYSPVIDDEKNIIGCLEISLDITNLSEARQALAVKNRELKKYIESNMQLENFAHLASHDLKAPLNNILNFSRLLGAETKGRLKEEEQKFLEFIISGAENMQKTIKALFAFSQTSNTKLMHSTFRPKWVLNNLLKDLQSTIDRENTILNVLDFPKTIFADETLFRQLLQNLILNAIKFSRKNVQPVIEIAGEEKLKYWQFYVKDNGIGIDDEFKEKIFLLFQRLHSQEKFEGTGTGLAICKKIIEFHRGKIWFEKNEFNGSTFYFTIGK